jgi:hypothetical protein
MRARVRSTRRSRRATRGLRRIAWSLGLLAWIKIGSMLLFALLVSVTWADGAYTASAGWARWSTVANILEPHRAHFNSGTASAAAGDLAGARRELERALTLTNREDECVVRLNLSLVLEAAADVAGSEDGPADLERARVVLAGAPAACREAQLDQIIDRIGAGPEPAIEDEPPPPDGEPAPAPAEPSPAELEALEDVMETAYNDMVHSETESGDTAPGTGVPRPW